MHWQAPVLTHARSPSLLELDQPISGELFSADRLELHAAALAQAHKLVKRPTRGAPLLARLAQNGQVLRKCHRILSEVIRLEGAVSPGAEWLVDNFHIVDEQLREIRDDLPPSFYYQLPKLAEGPLAGYPRVLALVWAYVEHSDSRFDGELLARFVRGYQHTSALTLGELWAIPISLRLVLVENLRRMAERMVKNRAERQEADQLIEELLAAADGSHARLLARRYRERALPTALAMQLVQHLRDKDPDDTPALAWLTRRLAAQGMTAEEVVREGARAQSAMHLSVRNVITSMRGVTAQAWGTFVEGVSTVDAILSRAQGYSDLDFASRDRYRHALEQLAKYSRRSEAGVAEAVVARASAAEGERASDVGYWLISRGRLELERELGYRRPLRQRLRRAYVRWGMTGYLASIGLVSVLALGIPLVATAAIDTPGALVLLALLAAFPASELAVAVVNRSVTNLVGPRRLPKLELAGGIPPQLATLVVVPTMLTSEAGIADQLERLEVHFLSNGDGEIRFALLADLCDAAAETVPADDALIQAAEAGLAALNAKYPTTGEPRFYLLRRHRRWNPSEGVWMGWERKRGKLDEVGRLLTGGGATSFVNPTVPTGIRYVITLDSDTRMPRDTARSLVGAMAHPLTRPAIDPVRRVVTDGHAILQPRVSPTLPSAGEGSVFQRVYSGPQGIDPYAFACSDVYQDLFGMGIFTGKGIYDVQAFQTVMAGRVPENTMLSHDLFEGLEARAGLISDVELFESFPEHYEVQAARQHRWTRGDWQLLPWLLGLRKAPMPRIGRWMMLDNLRRSLVAPASLALLLTGWLLGLREALLWSLFLVATIALPRVVGVLAGAWPQRPGVAKRSWLRGVAYDLEIAVWQTVLGLTMLAHQAWLMSDAIGRALWRLVISKRHMLEWKTADAARAGIDLDIANGFQRMAPAFVLAALAGALVGAAAPESFWTAFPILAAWALAPAIARGVSLPPHDAEAEPVLRKQRRLLRGTARRTWRYFETFVGPSDHHLPPDNVQEDPVQVIAHRTSPTNIGLYLVSAVSAHELGWLGHGDFVRRLEATLISVHRLERHHGHLFNWYDTESMAPLEPRYISTVDSGNLAGYLWTLAGACEAMARGPALPRRSLEGIREAVLQARTAALPLAKSAASGSITIRQLDTAFDALEQALATEPTSARDAARALAHVSEQAQTVADIAQALCAERSDEACTETVWWARAAYALAASHHADLASLLPWACGTATLPEAAVRILAPLDANPPSLDVAPAAYRAAAAAVTALADPAAAALVAELERAAQAASVLSARLVALAAMASELVDDMDFRALYDPTQKLLSIGYQMAEQKLDPSCYDLLASEARLASFLAIAKGEIPAEHWFRLGRALAPVARGSALVSWSGSMFEYLMPDLVLRVPSGGLFEQTDRLIVQRQIRYGAERDVPWGVSEAAYNARDLAHNYQYSAFGVPGLGLKRGLGDSLVVAPYATALAAMVDPIAAAENFERLSLLGAAGRYGFFESIDFTPSRVPDGQRFVVVRATFAHHSGMSLVALSNVLLGGLLRTYFHANPRVQATELLLQERTPRAVAVVRPRSERIPSIHSSDFVPAVLRRFRTPHTATPRTHLLSNGRYHVMMTAAGSGQSRYGDLALTRWREDPTRDDWGTHIYLRDAATGKVWSAGYQPTAAEPDSYQVLFTEDRVEIQRRDGHIATTMEVVVSGEDDAEIRHLTLTNHGSASVEIEMTSYAELVLAPQGADQAHPAFSNLFVQTSLVPASEVLLATRRPRSAEEKPIWLAHLVSVEGETVGALQHETDRARLLGRGRGVRNAALVEDGHPLSNTTGSVLDPVFSLRRRVRIPAAGTVRVSFTTLVGATREATLATADKYREPALFDRIATLAWTQAQIKLRHLGIDPEEAHVFQRLAARIIYHEPSLRASPEILERCVGSQQGLWKLGISGDLPIVLVRIDDADDRELVRQLLRAHEYWRQKGLAVDLVILNEKAVSYEQDLQSTLEGLVRSASGAAGDQRGRVFTLRGDTLTQADRDLLRSTARAVLLSHRGTLAQQVVRNLLEQPRCAPPPRPVRKRQDREGQSPPPLHFFNGIGGFTDGGREYVIVLEEGQWTPAPWINVIANPRFGCLASETGAGYTWSENSRQNQLTPWSNDPVGDAPCEILYLQDQDSGDVFGATPLPIRDASTYVIRHGQGYTRYLHKTHGLALELLVLVAPDDPIKISRLTIENPSSRERCLSVTGYVEWALGPSRTEQAPSIKTWRDDSGALFAQSTWNPELGGRVAFIDLEGQTSYTGDRTEVLGRHGSLELPAALAAQRPLSGRVGSGLDPCGAQQTSIVVPAGGKVELRFLLGQGKDVGEARALVTRYRGAAVEPVLAEVTRRWDDVLGTLTIKTPDAALDMLANRWLLYQTLSCRIFARTAFYQAGGAYGFRDQLQDVLALAVARRDVAREQLLRAAAHQFIEGDVQHWWHPPQDRGVRTRISDDLLFLPYVCAQYRDVTGDGDVLDEVVPFLTQAPLLPDQQDAYDKPTVSGETGTLYEHCARAIDHSLKVGAHGLPLMGGGDWNDGMNRVGHGGQGESVWLGWFLCATLKAFVPVARARGEDTRADRWAAHIEALGQALESHGWDGDWYRRAFFDDGTPLGSAANSECRIDSIAQSWGVLSGMADHGRATRAMAAVEELLVRKGDGLVLLFTPPFDKTKQDPGYIRGYLPGVRENGGQYTHAAVWSAIAFAALGDGDKAGELLALLNPINHSRTRAGMHRYKVEPYVAAADVYGAGAHVGRGGWTWYTGSAAWMYRACTEWMLGFRLRGTRLVIEPCIPRPWPGYEMTFRYHRTRYRIVVDNSSGAGRGIEELRLDGRKLDSTDVPLVDDGASHELHVKLGTSARSVTPT